MSSCIFHSTFQIVYTVIFIKYLRNSCISIYLASVGNVGSPSISLRKNAEAAARICCWSISALPLGGFSVSALPRTRIFLLENKKIVRNNLRNKTRRKLYLQNNYLRESIFSANRSNLAQSAWASLSWNVDSPQLERKYTRRVFHNLIQRPCSQRKRST